MQVRRAESARDMLDIFAIRRAAFNGEQGISLDREINDTDIASGTIHFPVYYTHPRNTGLSPT